MTSTSVASRAALALILMAGFYVLALAIVIGLFSVPYLLWTARLWGTWKLALFCVIGGAIVLWSIVPRPDRFAPPGPLLGPNAQPALLAAIRSVAEATRQQMPAEVYLVDDVNAWVAQRGGIMGFGSRRVMGLGLPLLQMVTARQLRAVLAHEFGHFYGGDTRLGPWVYKTREAIGRTLDNLAEHSEALQIPFQMYGALFLRLTHAVSRQQELTADALAVRVVGAQPLAEGLRVTHVGGAAFEAYWSQEVAPVLEKGFRPPITEGLGRFMSVGAVEDSMAKLLDAVMEEEEGDPYDTHPPLRERLAALHVSESARASSSDPRAVTLVEDVPSLEAALITHAAGPEKASTLEDIGWEEIGARVLRPSWGRAVTENPKAFEGVTVGGFPEVASRLTDFARSLKRQWGEPRDEDHLKRKGLWFLAAALGDTLAEAGWSVESLPGEPYRLRRGGDTVEPLTEVESLVEGRASPEDWRARAAAWGVAEADLGAGS